jgi:hypothetical protein
MPRSFIRAAVAACIACACAAGTTKAADEWKPAPNTIMTPWAEKVDPAHPLPEYPRPQMVRGAWTNLNGLWDYAITEKDAPRPGKWDGKILVPFCIESALSGVKKPLDQNHRLWYRRTFAAPELKDGNRLLLHFGAVDWETHVSVNGKEVGSHQGGYDPFTFDVTDALNKSGDNELVVSGIYYTPCSGIWQTVWLEPVDEVHVDRLEIIPDLDAQQVRVIPFYESKAPRVAVIVDVLDGERIVGTLRTDNANGGASGSAFTLHGIPGLKPWTPESPNLYGLHVTMLRDGKQVDFVQSYFAFRKYALAKDDNGILRPTLNNKPIFMSGPLDQGFWPDGIYTAPTDEALRFDIEMTKKFGFNCTRKHVKVEPDRWYYWCDKLGLIVWQDMPSGSVGPNLRRGATKDGVAKSPEAAKQFETELKAMIDNLRNHPSIGVWVIFNEGWGQYDTARIAKWVKEYDPTRIEDAVTGWEDRGVGDMHDMHHYPPPATYPPEENRIAVLGEFGGLGLVIPGHQWVASDKNWGYQNMAGDAALTRKYVEMWREVWRLRKEKGMSAAIYTQITDVETESNGLMSYDRKVIKIDPEKSAAAVAKGEFPPPPTYTTVIPTAEAEAITWRYTTESPGGDEWAKPSFDASKWKEGPAGFGRDASPSGKVRTEWATADIWLRREAEVSADALGKGDHGGTLMLRCYHDDDAEVYINGVLAANARRHNDGYDYFELTPKGAEALKPGKNVIAIHCHQINGGQYIDAGIVREDQATK